MINVKYLVVFTLLHK